MKNKCPKCGFEYGEFDLFCARCGCKLESDNKVVAQNQNDNIPVPDLKLFFKENKSKKSELFNPNKRFVFDSLAFNLVVVMVIAALVLVGVVYFTTNKHNAYKTELYYKSLMLNPSNIPELKEPQNYNELMDNLSEVQNFLLLYLKYSNDPIEKKDSIFTSYLDEMDKLSHITNENMVKDENDSCYSIKSTSKAKSCAAKFTKEFKKAGVMAFSDYNIIYLYPDYAFIKNTYSKYLSKSLSEYINLKAKYSTPVGVGLNLYIKPLRLANKIYDFEKLFNLTQDPFVKEQCEKILYNDFRKFIFTPSIYATTTQEMKKEFKNAYTYFIKTKKDSALRPVVMSYMDKKRSYDEDNFKNDYPYKMFSETFDDNVENNSFSDIFAQLRKSLFAKNSDFPFSYVYSTINGKWFKYTPNVKLDASEYIISEADENNSVAIYNNTLSLLQELNISKFGQIFIFNGNLFVYNRDKLSVQKITFNGRQFNLQNLSAQDVTSVFPGVEVINIDSYSNYNIYLKKDNAKATYIILSRYSQGYEQYTLSAIRGQIVPSVLPNMFTVNTTDDVLVAFHGKNVNPEETSDSAPTYKFVIKTRSNDTENSEKASDFAVYDKETATEGANSEQTHTPQIMPKIPVKSDLQTEISDDILTAPPSQNIEPPLDND